MATYKTSARHCCVPQCVSDDRYTANISFHKFPKEKSYRKQWISKIRRDEGPNFKITGSTVVCSRHFSPQDFKWTPVKKTLKKYAVPSVFHWVETKNPGKKIGRKQLAPLDRESSIQREAETQVAGAEETVGPSDSCQQITSGNEKIEIRNMELDEKKGASDMTTSTPTNASEWQLYYVLQRANLLQYYETFVAQGGDDVPQLCEAGEEEFLEIMALVGMASKPLHVRRLQKALQEWVANPGVFKKNFIPAEVLKQGVPPKGLKLMAPGTTLSNVSGPMNPKSAFQGNGSNMAVREAPTQVSSLVGEASTSVSSSPAWTVQPTPPKSVSPVSMVSSSRPSDLSEFTHSQLKRQETGAGNSGRVLSDEQITEISQSADKLVKGLPVFEPKPLSQKKDINKQIYEILRMPIEFTPERLEMMRKYAAIYRRFDSERAYSKPMTLHEVCVNEAAAQLCYRMPSLLTRREDLFPLSRQVVKGSGYQYSKGHSRSTDFNPENPSKRQKLDLLCHDAQSLSPLSLSGDREARQERLQQLTKELASVAEQQEQLVGELDIAKEDSDLEKVDRLQSELEQIANKHLQLLTEQNELLRKQSLDVYVDIDGGSDKEDSNFGASGSPSPLQADRLDSSQHSHNTLKTMLTTGQIPKSSLNSLSLLTGVSFTQTGMKNSLFDEGLRIAQQYGLGDFAEELKTLKDQSPKSETNENDSETGFVPSEGDSEKNGASNDSDGEDEQHSSENNFIKSERKLEQNEIEQLTGKQQSKSPPPCVKSETS